MQDEAEGADFDSESLQEETAFDFNNPWKLPIDTLRDYFGEKVALYFNFLTFYTYHLSYTSLLGLFVQLVQDNGSKDTRNVINIIFATFIIIWSTIFMFQEFASLSYQLEFAI